MPWMLQVFPSQPKRGHGPESEIAVDQRALGQVNLERGGRHQRRHAQHGNRSSDAKRENRTQSEHQDAGDTRDRAQRFEWPAL